MFGVRKACRELAEWCHETQQENDRLKAENAKLISVLHEVEAEAVDAYLGLQHDCELLTGELDDRFRKHWHEQVQNEKLRKLSSIMLKCIMAKERKALVCWECPMHKQFDELRSYCCLEHEAKELGIEVPE